MAIKYNPLNYFGRITRQELRNLEDQYDRALDRVHFISDPSNKELSFKVEYNGDVAAYSLGNGYIKDKLSMAEALKSVGALPKAFPCKEFAYTAEEFYFQKEGLKAIGLPENIVESFFEKQDNIMSVLSKSAGHVLVGDKRKEFFEELQKQVLDELKLQTTEAREYSSEEIQEVLSKRLTPEEWVEILTDPRLNLDRDQVTDAIKKVCENKGIKFNQEAVEKALDEHEPQ